MSKAQIQTWIILKSADAGWQNKTVILGIFLCWPHVVSSPESSSTREEEKPFYPSSSVGKCPNILIMQKQEKSQKDNGHLSQKLIYNFWPTEKRSDEGEKSERSYWPILRTPMTLPSLPRESFLIASQILFPAPSLSPALRGCWKFISIYSTKS